MASPEPELKDQVNSMEKVKPASENIDADMLLAALTQFKNGNFSAQLPAEEWTGKAGKIAHTFNDMVRMVEDISQEFKRTVKAVGKEGKIGERAIVPNLKGGWGTKVEYLNTLVTNLVQPMAEMSGVIAAVVGGDLSQRMSLKVDSRLLKGAFLHTAQTVNVMVKQLNSFASEVSRVAREVGTEGKLGGQAQVQGMAGVWKDLTDNVNQMAANLTNQVRNIAEVTTAVAKGDLTRKITVDVRGEILELKNTFNTMVDQLNSFASEVTRVAREVGTEGNLGGQADVKGVAGVWKDLTDNVNQMAANLTNQVRNIAEVTTAVANGDLTKKITVDVRGEILELKSTINIMVDQLNSFASEVIRVAREVGVEGRLGGQANVKGVAGTWKDLTENVNMMGSNLTNQVRNIADVTTAVANGDLSKKITVDVKGEILDLKKTINTMVDQLNSFASEVTRVAREVGTQGKLGGQADVKGVAGVWKDLTENVNMMASNLTNQVRNIAEVTTAVANGNLSKKITVDVKGEILDLKETINTMVDQLNSFASEVTRVAREVGTQGKLGGQADVKDVAGVWKDLTENVNMMGSNLTNQMRNIADVTTAVANGDLSKKITVDVRGEFLQLKETINTMVDQLNSFASEVTRVAREVGTEGRLGGQAYVQGVGGTWKDLTDNVNQMASNLTSQVRNIAAVTTAVANGDLSKTITVNAQGEILELKSTINTMVEQLSSFAAEVTRVAREVGTEGKLGGQAVVRGVGGIWKDLTDNVNQMGTNLTDQVRGIAKVVTAVAQGDLKKKLTVQAKGEIAELSETINNMIDTLATFAEQVTGVAREVGVEGRLGGQANVPGAAGTWKDLTDNVNQLAANLTTQVRAISEVATAVTKGDLSRSIGVEAQGEVAWLKDIINKMILNLKETTLKNSEQDWLKTNLAKFTRILQGQKDLVLVARLILSELAPMVSSHQGLFYIMDNSRKEPILKMLAAYAFKERKNVSTVFKIGEGLVGQCAYEKERILLTQVPTDYITINSGLGEGKPLNIVVLPIIFEGHVKAVIELASFENFSSTGLALLDQLAEIFGIVLNTIETHSRTEELLKQSQNMAQELQSQQEELQQTNEQLEDKAKLLATQNSEVAEKNRQIEIARGALEEKAKQLTLTSKYKSEFLANMSHELRTPLNSLLILSKQLSDNKQGNLTTKQVDFAKTIHAAGSDLCALINDILDLSKIESGTVSVEINPVQLQAISSDLERMFRHMAENKNVSFVIDVVPNTPKVIETDFKRLLQIFKNLLSNAFKFTEKGEVTFRAERARDGWDIEHPILSKTKNVMAFSVIDSGIGIPLDKQSIIFEAFQQADGTTSRRYGGTGLGLSISRELAHLLGGEIRLKSEPGVGSTFTLYLPQTYVAVNPIKNPLHEGVYSVEQLLPKFMQTAAAMQKDAQEMVQLENIEDDRYTLEPDDKVLLIVENDMRFARLLLELVRKAGLKGLVTDKGESALMLANLYKPHCITLDINLNDMDGLEVLKRLKSNPSTYHIPVHIITVEELDEQDLKSGAASLLVKPVSEEALNKMIEEAKNYRTHLLKNLLVVENDAAYRERIIQLSNKNNVTITVSNDAKEALEILKANPKNLFDCIIMDLNPPDGFKLLKYLNQLPQYTPCSVIISTDKELTKEEERQLVKATENIGMKNITSKEQLLEQISIFFHHAQATVATTKSQIPAKSKNINKRTASKMLNGKTLLIVDDDPRNIFAIRSALESHGIKVLAAENGKEGIKILNTNPSIDAVLMDIMMPEMDGYETTTEIRKYSKYTNLPIIALTAKAMKGDREKCIAAGATDYLSKPIDIEQLLSVLGEHLNFEMVST
jgi:HAMP domain-containing protein/signal transduction histidine kinase/CheY-like chemotaxis protein